MVYGIWEKRIGPGLALLDRWHTPFTGWEVTHNTSFWYRAVQILSTSTFVWDSLQRFLLDALSPAVLVSGSGGGGYEARIDY